MALSVAYEMLSKARVDVATVIMPMITTRASLDDAHSCTTEVKVE